MEIVESTDQDDLPLARVFASAPARILDFLLLNHDIKYTEQQISELSEIPPRTLQRTLKKLIEEGLIIRKRESRSYYYQANEKNKRVKQLIKFVDETIEENLATLAKS